MDELTGDLSSNRSADALLRDAERDLAKHCDAGPVDLRTIPVTDWDSYIGRDVTMPPFGASLLRDSPVPLPEKVVHCIEEWTERFHNIKTPYYIAMSLTLQRTGRAWLYEPKLAKLLTGLTLDKE